MYTLALPNHCHSYTPLIFVLVLVIRPKKCDESGIRNHALSDQICCGHLMTRSLVWRLRPLGHLAVEAFFRRRNKRENKNAQGLRCQV